MGLGDFSSAVENFKIANQHNKHEVTYLQLAKAHIQKKDMRAAVLVLAEALEYIPFFLV
jgi:hypothetical protein